LSLHHRRRSQLLATYLVINSLRGMSARQPCCMYPRLCQPR